MLITLYDRKKTYMFPSGKLATPEVVANEYPATQAFDYVFFTDAAGQVVSRMEPLNKLCEQYKVDLSGTSEEKMANLRAAIEAEEQANKEAAEARAASAESEVSNEELTATSLASIAASLEYQNMLTLDDAVTE